MAVSIEVASAGDAAAVTAVLEASYSRLMAGAYPGETLERALPAMVQANPNLLSTEKYYIARSSGGAIVGCGGWTSARPGTGQTEAGVGHIRHFATHPDWTGRGVGRALFEACEGQARAAGVHTFECYASLNARPFYEALGFLAIDVVEVGIGSGIPFPSVWMRCPI